MSKNFYTSNWSLDRIEQMTTLWSDGYSAGMIAKEMGGFESTPDGGRNSVIGKLHRMGLVGSEKPRYTLRRGNSYRRSTVAHVKVLRLPPVRAVVPEPLEAPQSLQKSILELHGGKCKWPSGDGPYTFCGHPVEAGPYCPWHRSVAFTKGTQRDVDRIASRAMGGITGEGKSTIMEA